MGWEEKGWEVKAERKKGKKGGKERELVQLGGGCFVV